MDGVIDMETARALVADAALWPRVRDFLWDFAPQVHRSWLDGLDGLEALENLENLAPLEPRSGLAPLETLAPRVKRWILDALCVAPCFHSFPASDGSRLLLLDGATLESIAKWLGALACADALRRVTDGATVRALRAALPGVYPEVFGYAEYFRGLDVWPFGRLDSYCAGEEIKRRGAEAQSAQRVGAVGYEVLFAWLADLPESLKTRLTLKLPKNLCVSAPLRLKENEKESEKESESEAVARPSKHPNVQTSKPQLRQLLRKVLKLRFPEAYTLCCS